jgi:hypothetical protein
MRPDGSYELKRPRGASSGSASKRAFSSQEQLQELICTMPAPKGQRKNKGK